MKTFMDKDFLLHTKTAQHLFHDYAETMPICDYHCHLSPQEIAEDKHYDNITEVWLYGDHYKWRFMRSMGVDEKYCTGDASDYDKFLAYAKCIGYAVGNPLYHWSHLELQRYFGIYDCLNEKTAPEIWEKANAVIRGGDFSAQKLILKSNVALIGTTDDPADSLEFHAKLKDFPVKVVPAFRPDKAVNITAPGYAGYIAKLSEASGIKIDSFEALKTALSGRIDFFHSMGSRISDHAFTYVPYAPAGGDELDRIFKNALAGGNTSEADADKFKTMLSLFCAEEYAKRGWVMQLHMGAMRNNNSRMFEKLGPDTGFDSVGDDKLAFCLSRFMDHLDKQGKLPKTILYSLNHNDTYMLGTMLGNFQEGGVRGKIQLGSGWWFNDHIDGMVEQLRALGNLGALCTFVGMLTDSRSFLSYPRHEYFRRILCNLIGQWVEDGEFDNNEEILKEIIEGICYKNANNYFNM